MTPELKALIEDLRLNHEFCPKEVILQAADELERLAQPEQEPDYWLGYGLQAHTEKPFEGATPIYTSPPQRKPLTDKAITQVINRMPKKMKGFMVDWDLYEFARAIEAAHGIKGEA
jgi:hypothetical protein